MIISILTIIVAILLILVVLIQNSKGGGLDTTYANANQLGGAAQSTETIEKATWTLAGALAILSLAAVMFVGTGNSSSKVETKLKGTSTTSTQQTSPIAPGPMPGPIPGGN